MEQVLAAMVISAAGDTAAAVAEFLEVDAVAVINLTHAIFRGSHHPYRIQVS